MIHRLLVCGGRTFGSYGTSRRGSKEWKRAEAERSLIFDTLSDLNPLSIIEGAAPGADTVAGEWAALNNRKLQEFPADWKKHGPMAGWLRNKQMLTEGQPDLVLAFPGGKGTAMMVELANKAEVPVIQIKVAP